MQTRIVARPALIAFTVQQKYLSGTSILSPYEKGWEPTYLRGKTLAQIASSIRKGRAASVETRVRCVGEAATLYSRLGLAMPARFEQVTDPEFFLVEDGGQPDFLKFQEILAVLAGSEAAEIAESPAGFVYVSDDLLPLDLPLKIRYNDKTYSIGERRRGPASQLPPPSESDLSDLCIRIVKDFPDAQRNVERLFTQWADVRVRSRSCADFLNGTTILLFEKLGVDTLLVPQSGIYEDFLKVGRQLAQLQEAFNVACDATNDFLETNGEKGFTATSGDHPILNEDGTLGRVAYAVSRDQALQTNLTVTLMPQHSGERYASDYFLAVQALEELLGMNSPPVLPVSWKTSYVGRFYPPKNIFSAKKGDGALIKENREQSLSLVLEEMSERKIYEMKRKLSRGRLDQGIRYVNGAWVGRHASSILKDLINRSADGGIL